MQEEYRWPWKLWDHRDRFVITQVLARRGWRPGKWSYSLTATCTPPSDTAEYRLIQQLWPPECLKHWAPDDLCVELRLLKAPGKAQQNPKYWEANPDATPLCHYGLQLNLMGVYPIPDGPAIAVVPKFDWKSWYAKRDEARQSTSALPYSEMPPPDVKTWHVRHSSYAGASRRGGGSKLAARASGFEVDQSPFLKHYMGIIGPADPLLGPLETGLDTICQDAVDAIAKIVSQTPLGRRTNRYVAKQIAKELDK
jgi:hypothetical protein